MHTRTYSALGVGACESELLGLGVNWILETRDCDKTCAINYARTHKCSHQHFLFISVSAPHSISNGPIPKELSQTKIFDPGPRIT